MRHLSSFAFMVDFGLARISIFLRAFGSINQGLAALLSLLLSTVSVSKASAWELPVGVDPSSVTIGYYYAPDALSGSLIFVDFLFGTPVTLADVSASNVFTVPEGTIFLPGISARTAVTAWLKKARELEFDETLTSNEKIALADQAALQIATSARYSGSEYSVADLIYIDFAPILAAALAAAPPDASFVEYVIPGSPFLVSGDNLGAYFVGVASYSVDNLSQDVIDTYVQALASYAVENLSQAEIDTYFEAIVTYAVEQYGLQLDDPRLAKALATIPTTYDPTAVANTGPTADAGADQTVDSEDSVTLNGTGSADPDVGDTLSYAWTQTGGTTVTLSDATAASPTFTAPALGANDAAETLTFSLVVTDDKSNASVADTVDVTVNPPANTGPTADAGADQTVDSGDSVTLDGTGSADPDVGDTLTYAWTQTGGTTVTLTGATTASPTFTAPTLGANDAAVTLTFSLVVTDDKSNASVADTVDVTVNPPDPTPASEFDLKKRAIADIVADVNLQNLRATVAANQKHVREARQRFITERISGEAPAPATTPVSVSGSLDANGTSLSSKGTFYGETLTGDGKRHLLFGDFDIQRDSETGSSTTTLTGRIAWEQSLSESTMLGYFIGGEFANSSIADVFSGDQSRLGVMVGGYAVHELAKNTYLDGYVTAGVGRNNLAIADNVLALESDYTTRSASVGAALSAVVDQPGYEIWPELSLSYGRTWIGDVGFTGRAYGLEDNTLSLDAGTVSLANIMFRPEFRVPLDGLPSLESLQLFTFAPRLICEQIKTTVTEESCGGGVEVGFTGHTADGLGSYTAKIAADRFGDRTNSAIQLNLEHRF